MHNNRNIQRMYCYNSSGIPKQAKTYFHDFLFKDKNIKKGIKPDA